METYQSARPRLAINDDDFDAGIGEKHSNAFSRTFRNYFVGGIYLLGLLIVFVLIGFITKQIGVPNITIGPGGLISIGNGSSNSTPEPQINVPTTPPKVQNPPPQVVEIIIHVTTPATPKSNASTKKKPLKRINNKELRFRTPDESEYTLPNIKAKAKKLGINAWTYYQVVPNDSLLGIAQKYGISKQDLMKANYRLHSISRRTEWLIIPTPDMYYKERN